MSSRHTITLNDGAYLKLKSKGVFGESYSELISRLADSKEGDDQKSIQNRGSKND